MNVFDLCATLSLDSSEYEKELSGAEKVAYNIGGKIGNGLKAGAKLIGAGITATATGVAKLVKDSTEAYADYEQLVGGVETLFKESADLVQEYADVAYRTAGLSANEYMETVTSFSASLLQSLDGDTQASAEKANQAIIDMSDNANKMGSSMESIQNAYNGFAKGNFTMLDNLKLGYGGTREEAERLVEDAMKLDSSFVASRDESGKLNLSFAEMADAIHIVQEEMGIAGTTQKEASETISGSIGMVKGAWTNLIAGLGNDNADLDKLIDELVSSAEIALGNIEPVLEKALNGIADVIQKVVPIISDKLPAIVSDLLPKLLESATTLFNGIVNALPTLVIILADQAPFIIESIVNALIDNLPKLIECASKLMVALAGGLLKALPTLVKALPQIVTAILKGLGEGVTGIAEVGAQMIEGLWNGISDKIGWITDKIKGFGSSVMSAIKGIFGIHSPSTVMRDQVGKMLALGVGEGWSEGFEDIKKDIDNDLDFNADVTTSTAVTSSTATKNNDILNYLREWIPQLANSSIVLDTGALVGQTVNQYDKALGKLYTQQMRYV